MKKQSNAYTIIIFYLIVLLFSKNYAQAVLVKGAVTASNLAVVNAVVTFVDNNDTTKKFSSLTDASGNFSVDITTSIESENAIPAEFELDQNYPNPFSSSTVISYKLNKQADVQITIYDVLGREVKKINSANQSAGIHGVLWDAKNDLGRKMAAGVYFYQMNVGNKTLTRKMLLGSGQHNNLSISSLYSAHAHNRSSLLKSSLSSGNYQIRVENGARTNPVIIPKKINNVLIARDTTINVAVEKAVSSPVATIDVNSMKQIIRGFGASNVILWRPDMTSSEVETAFGTGNGQIGFSILRIMVESDSNRWSLYLSTVKKAQSLGATIIASPWYAPAEIVETVNNVSRVRHNKYSEYVAHLNSFLSFMKRNGVNIYGISVQNEPDITENWTSWTPAEMFTFMKENAGAIKGALVMAPESFQFRRNISDPILNDSTACANTDIICGHIYGAGLASYPLAKAKGKEVWMTEYLFGEQNSANNWSWAVKVATNMTEVMKADMSAYVWWNIIRYYGPIGDGEKAVQNPNESYPKKGEVTKKGYVMSQFSRFIRPGYYRIESNIYPASVGAGADVTAYKDPVTSRLVIVAVNTSTDATELTVKIQNGLMNNTYTTYTTSASKNCEKGSTVTMSNNTFKFIMEPSSITTFVSE
jgi:glucuronoarabinoxylan endo-1,4-beta-xylanase